MVHVRLPLVNRQFLIDKVDNERLLKDHSECRELLIEAMRYHLSPEQRCCLSTTRTTDRKPKGVTPYIYAIGTIARFRPLNLQAVPFRGKFLVCHPHRMRGVQPKDRLVAQHRPHAVAPLTDRSSRLASAALCGWRVMEEPPQGPGFQALFLGTMVLRTWLQPNVTTRSAIHGPPSRPWAPNGPPWASAPLTG